MAITIFHNPACGTSRNTLAMIRNSGEEPAIVEYLKTPPTRAELVALIAASGRPVADFVRRKEAQWAEFEKTLDGAVLGDAQLIDLLVDVPRLLERPIVVTPLGTRLCRPSEAVLDILPSPQRGAFTKEDGQAVVDAQGRRIGG